MSCLMYHGGNAAIRADSSSRRWKWEMLKWFFCCCVISLLSSLFWILLTFRQLFIFHMFKINWSENQNCGNARDRLSGRKRLWLCLSKSCTDGRVASRCRRCCHSAVTLLSLWSQTVVTFADYCNCRMNVQRKYNWVTTKGTQRAEC